MERTLFVIWLLCLGISGTGTAFGRPLRRILLQVDPSAQQLDPRAWAPFLPPPNALEPLAVEPPPASTGVYYPPAVQSSDLTPPSLQPLQKPSAAVLPSVASGAPTPSPSVIRLEANNERKINRSGLLLTLVLVPVLLGGSLILSTLIAWICHRPQPLASADGRCYSGRHSSSGFAPWLWGRSSIDASHKELASSFEYSLLQTATNNFSTGNLLGEGGSSRVYKARLDEDSFAAVKLFSAEGKQAEQGFQAEVELLSKIRHPNLVSLLGFCSHEDQRLLVYEYMQNGSLQDQLHGPSRGSALTWYLRLKIALDSARGLEHLHEHCSPLVIHRDFKSSNVLLNSSFNAKVADFGLALAAPSATRGAGQGTLGYVAPEYLLNGSLTEKSDVYAFGVVLLELITGKKPVDPSGSLVNWVMPFLVERATLSTIVDPMLRETVDLDHLHQVAAVAVLCVQTEPSYRPLIADVVLSLIPLVPVELGGSLHVAQVAPENKSFAALQWNSASDDSVEAYDDDLYY